MSEAERHTLLTAGRMAAGFAIREAWLQEQLATALALLETLVDADTSDPERVATKGAARSFMNSLRSEQTDDHG